MNKIAVIALAFALGYGPASAQDKVDQTKTQELKKVDPVPPATGKSPSEQAGTQEPGAKVKGADANADVLVNGSLAVSGAVADADTVPSKYSARNAASDKLPIAAFRLRHLTEVQRREIYQHLRGGLGGLALSPAYAMVGAQVPAGVALRDLRPVPEALAAKFSELRGAAFVGAGAHVLLIDTRNNLVIGVLPAP